MFKDCAAPEESGLNWANEDSRRIRPDDRQGALASPRVFCERSKYQWAHGKKPALHISEALQREEELDQKAGMTQVWNDSRLVHQTRSLLGLEVASSERGLAQHVLADRGKFTTHIQKHAQLFSHSFACNSPMPSQGKDTTQTSLRKHLPCPHYILHSLDSLECLVCKSLRQKVKRATQLPLLQCCQEGCAFVTTTCPSCLEVTSYRMRNAKGRTAPCPPSSVEEAGWRSRLCWSISKRPGLLWAQAIQQQLGEGVLEHLY
ncbi:hypothetical protein AOLI_G00294330 [Acnodon oligacanthus]